MIAIGGAEQSGDSGDLRADDAADLGDQGLRFRGKDDVDGAAVAGKAAPDG